MINLPDLLSVRVEGYDLYPGTKVAPGLDITLGPDVTLIVGANGLGKSTLLRMLQFAMGGLSTLSVDGDLGEGQLKTRRLTGAERRTFATRVDDEAENARVSVEFELGTHRVRVVRSLADLSLVSLTVDGTDADVSEETYETCVIEASGLKSWLDWHLILRYLVLYGDDRPSLVWDPSAQRRLLRVLFLEGVARTESASLEQEFLKLDSRVRNTSANLNSQQRSLNKARKAARSAPVTRKRLSDAIENEHVLQNETKSLADEIEGLRSERQDLIVRQLQLKDRVGTLEGFLSRFYDEAIRVAFPTFESTSQFLYSQILSSAYCRTCGNDVPEFAEVLKDRLSAGVCVVCGSTHEVEERGGFTPEDRAAAIQGESERGTLVESIAALESELTLNEQRSRILISKQGEVQRSLYEVKNRVTALRNELPAGDRAEQLESAIEELIAINEGEREHALGLKEEFAKTVDAENRLIARYEKSVKSVFDRVAAQFLVERCELVWSRSATKLGQLGKPIYYSLFEVDMSGGGGSVVSRRNAPSEVSESQAQFIDLAFRMALISVAASGGKSTLIIDTPESSLDAVFAPRAAKILTDFAASPARLMLTSNLTEGRLVPTIAQSIGIRTADDSRVVNLLAVGRPTAATTELADEYANALQATFNVR